MGYALFCCWQATKVQEIDWATLKLAVDFSSNWNKQVVQPLRGSRRWMKTALVIPDLHDRHKQLRQQIKQSELAAERIQQAQLQFLADSKSGAEGDVATPDVAAQIAATNISRYLKMADIEPDQASLDQLLVLLKEHV